MSQREMSQAGIREGTSATVGDPSSSEPSGNRSGRSCSEAAHGVSQPGNPGGAYPYIPRPPEPNATNSSLPRLNPGVGSGNFFLGGQHIEQFFAAPSCSTKHGLVPTQAAATVSSPERAPAITPTQFNTPGSDTFQQWILENAMGK
ncbi:hypothetical protein AHAS_Ahas17G0075600 [Arachis hypogaea]